MIREVITISRITANREELNLSCGHSVSTNPEEVKKLATEAAIDRTHLKVDCKVCDSLIYRLHTRADIRRNITTRKSVLEGQPDRIADLLDEAGQAVAECLLALQPFAECIEYINPEEDDEEWAKFRLLIKNYRQAAATFAKFEPRRTILAGALLPEQPG
jgi:hypothetical protein